jgi:hypothetical protein
LVAVPAVRRLTFSTSPDFSTSGFGGHPQVEQQFVQCLAGLMPVITAGCLVQEDAADHPHRIRTGPGGE